MQWHALLAVCSNNERLAMARPKLPLFFQLPNEQLTGKSLGDVAKSPMIAADDGGRFTVCSRSAAATDALDDYLQFIAAVESRGQIDC